MKIAIIAFGSLIKEPKNLKLATKFKLIELFLPVEFSRISLKGNRKNCLTLVVDDLCPESICQVYAAISSKDNLKDAIENLAEREKGSAKDVGICAISPDGFPLFNKNSFKRHSKSCELIYRWLKNNKEGVEAVLWAGQSRRFFDAIQVKYTPENALSYLNGLPLKTYQRAIKYIDDAPITTDTVFRKLFNSRRSNIEEIV